MSWQTWVIGYAGTWFILAMLVDAGPGSAEMAVALAVLITAGAGLALLPKVIANLGLTGGLDVFGIKAAAPPPTGGPGAGRDPIGRVQRQPDLILFGRQWFQYPAGSVVRDNTRAQVAKPWN